MHLGRKIKIARIAKGLTQQDLADKIGKTRPLISSIEQTGHVNLLTLQDICKVLGVDLDEIAGPHSASEALSVYVAGKAKDNSDLRTENAKLTAEVTMMRDLIHSQKELIRMLKKELTTKKTGRK